MRKVPRVCPCAALPTTLLVEILQHVPQKQRLKKCALVCTAWTTAAAQATLHVQGHVKAKAVPSLQSWLAVHAGQLATLNLHVCRHHKLQLPLEKLTKLQHLKLHGFKLLLPSNKGMLLSYPVAGSSDSSRDGSRVSSIDGSSYAAQLVLSNLQTLELDAVQLSSVNSLLQLTRAPQLTKLFLTDITVRDLKFSSKSEHKNSQQAVEAVAAAVCGVLQHLPQLTALSLPGIPFSDAAVQQTSAMHQLQDLTLTHVDKLPVCNLQHLCSSITQLQLNAYSDPSDPSLPAHMGPSLPPQLPQLSRLLRLELTHCKVPPLALATIPQLQHLEMIECGLLPNVPEERFATVGTAALLDALSKLTSLESLTLRLSSMDTHDIEPQLFSALTASSHLTRLDMSRHDFMTIQRGAAQHMFPPGRQMPSLRQLAFNTSPDTWYHDEDWCIDSDDLRCIAQGCPALESMELGCSVKPGADWSPILQLPQCFTSLEGVGVGFTDTAAPVVAQLTQLRYLSWEWSWELTDVGLEHLTALDLTLLYLLDCGISEDYLHLSKEPELSVSQQLEDLLEEQRKKEAAAAREQEYNRLMSRLEEDFKRSEAKIQRCEARIQQLEQLQQQARIQQQQQLDAAQAQSQWQQQ